ncbi:MAG: dephospho-CoA kinase [Acidobacteria bacterium]|nr:dephospho-CoA kinase [Acidobacteriota bacterium]
MVANPVRRIALTGGIATGKSYVRGRLEKLGVPTVDSDTLAHEVIAPGTAGFAAVLRRFGGNIVSQSGEVDRQKLGAIVFADSVARRDLEAIVHPAVRAAVDRWFLSLDPAQHPFAIADIPLLYEVNRQKDFEKVIVTACDPATQLRRVMDRTGSSEWEARQRLAAQLPIEDKIQRADYVIRTDGSLADTDKQVKRLVEELKRA